MPLVSYFPFWWALLSYKEWAYPLTPTQDLSTSNLLLATFLSVSRIAIAYFISSILSVAIGYWAAHSSTAERIIISMIDTLQIVPILGFLPATTILFMSLFPQTDLELKAILMIFTSMPWNMALGFYSSLKNIPENYKELIRCAGYGKLGTSIPLDYSAPSTA